MIWLITKRAVLKKIHEMRWYGTADHTQTDWERRYNGVPVEKIETETFFNEMSSKIRHKWYIGLLLTLLGLISPYFKNYIENFIPKLKQTIKILKEEDYMKEEKGCFILTGKGEDYVSWKYGWKVFLRHPITIEVLKWAIITFISAIFIYKGWDRYLISKYGK